MREKVTNLKKSDGFTIIEVLIVLAIAGLIMLIVFLAVPQLQRNARNQQRKSDASALITAVSEFTSNNNGNAPATATDRTSLLNIVPSSKRAYYKKDANIKLTATATAGATVDKVEEVNIMIGAKCAATGGATELGTARSIVVLFAVENSGGSNTGQPQCLESGV